MLFLYFVLQIYQLYNWPHIKYDKKNFKKIKLQGKIKS